MVMSYFAGPSCDRSTSASLTACRTLTVGRCSGGPLQRLAGRPSHELASSEGVTSYVVRWNQSPFVHRSWRARTTATAELPIGAHTVRTHASASSETGTGAIASSPGYSPRTSSFSATSRAFAACRPISKARRASATSTCGGPCVASVTCSTSSGFDSADLAADGDNE